MSLITDSPFKPVPRRRAFEDVIVQVEEAIADGRIGPGDRLPPERELAGQLRVSRASVREALRVLEAFGVVTSRQGRGADAGSVVSAGDQNGLAGLLRIYTLLMKVPLSDLVDLRVAIESMTARARRRAARGGGARRAGRRDGGRAGPRPLPGARHRLPRRARPGVRQRARAAADGGAARDDRRAACATAFREVEDWESTRARVAADHLALAEQVAAGDADAAERTVTEHIRGFYALLHGKND